MREKVLVVLGATSTGKSDIAVALARHFGGEIISADSRQVYRGLDIGSGKITTREMRGIPHWGLSIANPKRVYSVSKYKKFVETKIADILHRGKLPIICGGTGFYIDAVVSGSILPPVPPNPILRKELSKKSTDELYKELKILDKKRAKNIDQHNKVRLIRAIEIARTLGQIPKIKKIKPKYDFVKLGLTLDEETLKHKIEKRLLARMKRGLVAEVRTLHEDGLSYKRLEALGLEYREVAKYLQGKISKFEMVENLKRDIYKYAKRQKTWWKKDREIIWFDPRSSFSSLTRTLSPLAEAKSPRRGK